MNLEFSSADEARAARLGGGIATAFGCHIAPMTLPEAQAVMSEARKRHDNPIGYCPKCDRYGQKLRYDRNCCVECFNFSNRQAGWAKRRAAKAAQST